MDFKKYWKISQGESEIEIQYNNTIIKINVEKKTQ